MPATLTREDMKRIVTEEKGSFLFDGELISEPSKIPSQERIDEVHSRPAQQPIRNDPAILARVQALEAQVAELRTRLDELTKPAPSAKK